MWNWRPLNCHCICRCCCNSAHYLAYYFVYTRSVLYRKTIKACIFVALNTFGGMWLQHFIWHTFFMWFISLNRCVTPYLNPSIFFTLNLALTQIKMIKTAATIIIKSVHWKGKGRNPQIDIASGLSSIHMITRRNIKQWTKNRSKLFHTISKWWYSAI